MNILPFNCKSTLFLSCFVILKLGPANMSPLMAGQCRLCQERAAEIQQRKEPLLVPTCFLPSHAFGGICESCLCVCVCCSVVSDYLWPHGLQPAKLLCPCVFQARILEWVAISFSRGSSQPEDWSQFCTAGRFFTVWATQLDSCESELHLLCRVFWTPQLTVSFGPALACRYPGSFLHPSVSHWLQGGLNLCLGVEDGEKHCQVLSPFVGFLPIPGVESPSAVLSALVFALLCLLVVSHPLLS